eukprot:2604855-Prorocentrum_lima.AAC.1
MDLLRPHNGAMEQKRETGPFSSSFTAPLAQQRGSDLFGGVPEAHGIDPLSAQPTWIFLRLPPLRLLRP